MIAINIASRTPAPLNHPTSKNKIQPYNSNVETQHLKKTKQTHINQEYSNKNLEAQKITKQTVAFQTRQTNDQNEANYVRIKLSLATSFAIKQYETLGNIETQQARSALFGFNDYA